MYSCTVRVIFWSYCRFKGYENSTAEQKYKLELLLAFQKFDVI